MPIYCNSKQCCKKGKRYPVAPIDTPAGTVRGCFQCGEMMIIRGQKPKRNTSRSVPNKDNVWLCNSTQGKAKAVKNYERGTQCDSPEIPSLLIEEEDKGSPEILPLLIEEEDEDEDEDSCACEYRPGLPNCIWCGKPSDTHVYVLPVGPFDSAASYNYCLKHGL